MQALLNYNIQNKFRYSKVILRLGRKCRYNLGENIGMNDKQCLW